MLQKNTIPLHRKNDKVAKTFQKIKKNQKDLEKKTNVAKKINFSHRKNTIKMKNVKKMRCNIYQPSQKCCKNTHFLSSKKINEFEKSSEFAFFFGGKSQNVANNSNSSHRKKSMNSKNVACNMKICCTRALNLSSRILRK